MNVVMVISDTFRWDHLGASGNEWIHTPNLDKLASESLLFTKAYTGSFPTIPHRTDLMTGKWVYPYRGWSPLPKEEPALAPTLTEAGYTTMLINDTPHLMRDGHCFDRGFSAWKWNRGQESDRAITDDIKFDMPCAENKIRNPGKMISNHYRWRERNWKTERDTFAAQTLQDAADWIEMNHTRENYFLYVDTFDPHEPWDPPQHYVEMYDPGYEGEKIDHPEYTFSEKMGLTEAEIKHAKALYAGEVTLVDTWVGRLLEKIDHCGQRDNTMVIFHSDHGFNVGDHGRFGKNLHGPGESWPFFEEVSHVPLIIRMPGGLKGATCDFLAQAVDIMPTILDACGVDHPEGLKGFSLIPALHGEKMPERPVVMTTQQMIANGKKKGDAMASITDGTWTLHYRGPANPWELYNIEEDPAQEKNLADTHRAEAERLHAAHLEQMKYAGVGEDVIEQRSKLP